jgi:hypothetical protein
MYWEELRKWRDTFASSAMTGNQFAKEMMNLWNTDKQKFISELEKFKSQGRKEVQAKNIKV